MRKILTLFLLLLVFSCTAKNSTSEVKLVKGGDDAILTEDGVIKGICLQQSLAQGNSPETCSSSTLQGCRELRSETVRATFVQTPSCACYELEQRQLEEFDRLHPVKPSNEVQFALRYDDIPEATESPVEILNDLDDFYKKHPECVVSDKESILLP